MKKSAKIYNPSARAVNYKSSLNINVDSSNYLGLLTILI